MFRILYLLISSVFLFQYIESVRVTIEDDQKKYVTSFPLPVMDGVHIRENSFHTLELDSREVKDKNEILKSVCNFPKLQYINISDFDLEFIPKFMNLPVVELLIFEFNDLSKVTANTFSQLPNLKEVDFSSNIIDEVENEAFGISVTEVYLSCNLLTEIKTSWFQNPGGLETLAARDNKISFLEENLFKSFVNLTLLDLANNEITTIGDGAFPGQKYYDKLNIQGNQIVELRSTIFSSSNVTIKMFNIGLNRLNFLASSFLDKIRVNRFLIFGNPWQCPCYKKIENWLFKNGANSTVFASDRQKWSTNNPVCVYALSFADICVEAVDNELYNSYAEGLTNIDTKRYC